MGIYIYIYYTILLYIWGFQTGSFLGNLWFQRPSLREDLIKTHHLEDGFLYRLVNL